MKLGLYMYDDPISLNEESTKDFIEQYDSARDLMTTVLDMFSESNTSREAIFFMLGLRTLIDDFLEFCTTGVSAELIERLLNGDEEVENEIFEALESEMEPYFEDDYEGEILVEFDDDEEE
jgi:hypothetical protein